MSQRNLIIIAVVLTVAGGAYVYFSHPNALHKITAMGTSAEQFAVQQIKVSTPPPLKEAIKNLAGANTTLTRAGVIDQTNGQRAMNGNLKALKENNSLDVIAQQRLDDMFAKQYFAHVAPDGSNAQKVAASVGYDYLAIGENLAQGNFPGDKGVVDAWMGSEGHRENILDTHYTQIGVAVKEGMFQGEKTWLAVQIFGRPASDCPAPKDSLKTTINANEAQLGQLDTDLDVKKADIDRTEPKSGQAYNAKIKAYNDEAAQYNDLAATTKQQVADYNSQVKAYNACINSL